MSNGLIVALVAAPPPTLAAILTFIAARSATRRKSDVRALVVTHSLDTLQASVGRIENTIGRIDAGVVTCESASLISKARAKRELLQTAKRDNAGRSVTLLLPAFVEMSVEERGQAVAAVAALLRRALRRSAAVPTDDDPPGVAFEQVPVNVTAMSDALEGVLPLGPSTLAALSNRCGRRVNDAKRLHQIVTERKGAIEALTLGGDGGAPQAAWPRWRNPEW
jgi:hypothetical protein